MLRTGGTLPTLLLAAALTGMCAMPLRAQLPREQIEAAYLAKFARYVTWPPSRASRSELQLCIIGQDPFQRALDNAVRGEKVGGKSVSIRRVVSARGAAGCDIAYVQGVSDAETQKFLDTLTPHPVLTVTSSRGGTSRGVIHFVVRDDRVRFHIDDASASRRGLGISSRLLSIAAGVTRGRAK